MEEGNETQPHRPSLNAGANANAECGTDNTDTSLNGEYRAGAGIYVNAQGEWTDPNGTVLRGQALMNAEANASAKYGVGYRNGNLYIEAVAEAKLRAEVSLKAEIESGQHAAGVELYAYAELYAWAGGEANNTSVSAGAQVGGTIGGGYQVPDWNQDSKPITIGGSVNLALIVGVKTEGTVTVDVDPAYDAIVETNNGIIEEAEELLKTKEAQRIKREAEEAQRKLDETAAELKRQSDAAAVELKRQTDAAAEALRLRQAKEESDKLARKIGKSKANPKNWKF